MRTLSIISILLFLSISASSQDIDIFEINENGIKVKTGTYRQNTLGGYDVYQNNQYGIQVKTGEIRPNSMGGYDVFKNNKYGILIRSGSLEPDYLPSYEKSLNAIPLPTRDSGDTKDTAPEDDSFDGVISY